MRFLRIEVRHFGCLRNLDTGEEPLPRLVAVYAPNEGGKSTLFSFLASLLYGFYPASRERHPYTPWSGEDIDGAAELALDDREEVRVHRRLLSSPWGRVTRDGRVENVRNNTVPWANHVQRQIFEQVYALTLGDLARLEEDNWQEIQDRLLGSMGADDLRRVRSVVSELESDATDLWRADRRGKPRARELQERLGALREERLQARERDRRLRDLDRELAELRLELENLEEERLEAEAATLRGERLQPVHQELQRIEREEERAGDPAELEGLPQDPEAELKRREEALAELQERIREREEALEELRAEEAEFGETDRRILAEGSRIRQLGKVAGEIDFARTRLEAAEARLDGVERSLDAVSDELLSVPWTEVSPEAIREFPLGELRTRVRSYQDGLRKAAGRRERLAALEQMEPATDQESSYWPGFLLLLGGVGAAGWGALDSLPPVVVALGLATALAGGLLLGLRRLESRRLDADQAHHRRSVDQAKSACDRAVWEAEDRRGAVQRTFEAIPIVVDHLQDPDHGLVQQMEEVLRLFAEREEVRGEVEGVERRIEETREELDRVEERVGLDLPEEDVVAGVVELEEALRRAEERKAASRVAGQRRAEIEEEVDDLRSRMAREEEALEALRTRLESLAEEGDPVTGAREATRRLRSLERARGFRERLEAEYPDLDVLMERLEEAREADESWLVDERALVRARDRIQNLNEREKKLRSRIQEVEGEMAHLRQPRTLDQVESEIETLTESLADLQRRRDRLMLLASILRTADHRFREENQPNLLRLAGRHLGRITGGRYNRLLIPEGDLEGTLVIGGPDHPRPMEVDAPLSTGTREQIYLSLRLAIVDHLDAGEERLPLFLDETLVNWDAARRDRGFELLARLAKKRQIFLFTCHASMARELEQRGARVLRLDRPS